jgi:hypothetical protein
VESHGEQGVVFVSTAHKMVHALEKNFAFIGSIFIDELSFVHLAYLFWYFLENFFQTLNY